LFQATNDVKLALEVLPRNYDNQVCSVARTLEVIGDRWTLLVVRDLFFGLRRFEDLQRDLGVARNVLSDRLTRLADEGIVERGLYQERPERYEYRLTSKGKDLWPVMISLMKWGDRHALDEGGAPTRVVHKNCGGEIDERFNCRRCGELIDVTSSTVIRRPDLMPAPAS
jgi:DNA-binding HxlR family transcriptional regulator